MRSTRATTARNSSPTTPARFPTVSRSGRTLKSAHCLLRFCHRTFCDTDLLYFVHFLRDWYGQHASLETAFLVGHSQRERLINFHNRFFSLPDAPQRTRKHVATPARGSACKRVNMYLRWLVRRD